MSLQERIFRRQNDEDMLKCQYVARHSFNLAETFSTLAFFFSMLSIFCVFVPDCILLPLALDALSILFYFLMGKSVSIAALLRNYFDETVLGLSINRPQSELRKIQEYIVKYTSKNKAEYQRQITHTGRDVPPGVKDWYEFSKDYEDSEVVFECQKQNQWWNKKMTQQRMITYLAIVLACIVAIALIHFYLQVSHLLIAVCFGSAIITFCDRIYENVLYLRLSMKISDYCEAYSSSRDDDQIRALQKLIENRRELRVVEINYIHKKISKWLSEQYAEISGKS